MNTKFIHLRHFGLASSGLFLTAKGGATIGYRKTDDGEVAYAVALCNDHDHYNKSIGRAIATGRLDKGIKVSNFNPVEDVPLAEQVLEHAKVGK